MGPGGPGDLRDRLTRLRRDSSPSRGRGKELVEIKTGRNAGGGVR